MVRFGDIHLSPSLILKNVLHVPKLTINFVLVYHILCDTNCVLTFHLDGCVIQDRSSRKKIESVRESNDVDVQN